MRHFGAFVLVVAATAYWSTAVDSTQQSSGTKPESLAEFRKLLADPKPSVRLNAALALAPLPDEQAIGALIALGVIWALFFHH